MPIRTRSSSAVTADSPVLSWLHVGKENKKPLWVPLMLPRLCPLPCCVRQVTCTYEVYFLVLASFWVTEVVSCEQRGCRRLHRPSCSTDNHMKQ